MVIYADPAGCDAVPWMFEWVAYPDDPGKTIDAFRYGFDIVDLNDPNEWDVDWCECVSAPPRTFYFGTHTFHVEVRDNTGAVTRGSIRIDVVPIAVPTLTLTESTRGEWVFVGPNGPPVSLSEDATDPPSPWEFEWEAYSCVEGAGESVYRYGWDIADPGDENEWTPWGSETFAPPEAFSAGVHTFMVEAKDGTGAITRGTVVFEVIPGPVPVEKTTWGGIKARYAD
jgi:hypothetical protein